MSSHFPIAHVLGEVQIVGEEIPDGSNAICHWITSHAAIHHSEFRRTPRPLLPLASITDCSHSHPSPILETSNLRIRSSNAGGTDCTVAIESINTRSDQAGARIASLNGQAGHAFQSRTMQQPRRHASHSVTNPATMSTVTLRGQSRQPSSFNSVDNAIEVASSPAFRHTVGRSFGTGVTSRRPNVHRSGRVHTRHEVAPPRDVRSHSTTDSSPQPPVPPPAGCRPNPTTPSTPSAHGRSRCARRASARWRSRSRWRGRGIRSGGR